MTDLNQQPIQEKPVSTAQPKQINKKRTLLIIIVIVFFLLLIITAIGIGAYILLIKNRDSKEVETEEKTCTYNNKTYNEGESFQATDGCNTCGCENGQVGCTFIACGTSETTTTTNTSTTVTTPAGYPVLKLSLQEIINTKCEEVEINGGYSSFIFYSYFPFQLSSNTNITIPTPKPNEKEGVCITGEYLENKGAISFAYKNINGDQKSALIHDEYSEELGHGGSPFYGQIGDVIKEGDDFIISAFLTCTDMCGGSVDEYSAHVRIRKILKFKGGEEIYINSDLTLFGQGNTTFKTYLNQNLENYNGTMVVDDEKAQDNFVKYFFADLSNLDSSQKEIYREALDFIRSIEYKK